MNAHKPAAKPRQPRYYEKGGKSMTAVLRSALSKLRTFSNVTQSVEQKTRQKWRKGPLTTLCWGQ